MASILPLNQSPGAQLPYSSTPDRYTSLGDLVNGTKEDVRDIYAAIYGDQGLSGLVEVIGAKKSAGTSDETVWFEEGRLGTKFTVTAAGTIATVAGAQTGETQQDEQNWVRANDVLLSATNARYLVESVSATAITVKPLNSNDATGIALPSGTYTIIGNAYAQGTNQPSQPFSPRLTRRANPFTIVKESFHVTGSQASNVGWVNVGGQNMWYLKGELDARRKFLNMREGMMVFGQKVATFNQDAADIGVPVNEGFFDAIEDRGSVAQGAFSDMADFDQVIVRADAQGIPAENALYLNTTAMLQLDSAIANAGSGSGDNAGAMASYGAFNNNKDMAIAMGFKSFTRGGYTFHKHSWKLLNDPTMGGNSTYTGGLIPLSIITDMKTGNRHHSLEMNYKSAGNYSRELEHWVEGGGVLGYNTGGEDLAKFNYRSECNLCVRGANQFVAFK